MNNFYALSEKAVAYFTRSIPITAILVRAALICSLYLCCNGYATAQPNCSSFSGTMITNFADWDWTIPTNHPNYCATWAAVLTSNPGTKLVVGAPWFGFQNGAVDKINLAQDYTKAKGWELLRMNMGGLQPVKTAHFILYNKYSGIIRTFFYIDKVAPFTKGMTITMSHTSSNGNRNSGVLALSQPLVQSQDYYLQNQSLNDEVISYVPVFTANEGWVYADFQVGFDSYTGNARYSSTSLQFAVSATTFSDVRLDGKFNFQTSQDIQGGGFAVGGKATNAGLSGLNNFLTKGQKVLKSFNYEDLTKFKSSFTAKADKTAATVPIPAVQAQQSALKSAVASSSSSGGLLKKVSGIAGSLGSAFGLISTVIGVLWPEESSGSSATFIPTVSTGTLSLQGTISTSAPYTSLTMQIPGGQHFFPGSTGQTDGGNQPFYDCPLGIFNIKNTPQLNKYAFTVYDGRDCEYDDWNSQWTCQDYFSRYDSYQVTNDLAAVYNDAAGLKLQSVQAALVAETPPEEFNKELGPFSESLRTTILPGFLRQRVYSGEVEVIAANDSLVTYATPFIDLGSFKDAAITVGRGSKVYVRIKAVLQRKDMPADAPPVFFVQDYAVQVSPTTVETNPRYAPSVNAFSPSTGTNFANGQEAPFTNLASALLVPTINPGAPYSATQREFTSTAPYSVPARAYWSDELQVSSITMISAGATPFNPASGAVTVQGGPGSDQALLLSNTGVALGPGFSVTPGTNFVAATPLQAWRQGGPALIEAFGGPCSYNANTNYNPVAYREGKTSGAAGPAGPAVTTDALTLSPNPTNGIVTIVTAVAGETGGVVVVSDYMGREVQRIETIPTGLSNQQINLVGKASGLYFVRLITGKGAVTQKVLLQ